MKIFADITARDAYNVSLADLEASLRCFVQSTSRSYTAAQTGAGSSAWSDPYDVEDVAGVQTEVDALEVVVDKIEWASVRVASTSNITVASPGATIDGVTMATGNRVLLAGQSTGAQNGLYVYATDSTPMTRATDADASGDFVTGKKVYVREGTANGQSVFTFTTTAAFTLATTTPDFAKTAAKFEEVLIGPFTVTLAADQADAAMTHGVSTGAFVAPAGYIVGLSGYLSAALTGAGTTATVEVDVAGSQVAGLTLPFTEAGAETVLSGSLNYGVAAGVVTADQKVRLIYTSTTITNTPVFVGHIRFAKLIS